MRFLFSLYFTLFFSSFSILYIFVRTYSAYDGSPTNAADMTLDLLLLLTLLISVPQDHDAIHVSVPRSRWEKMDQISSMLFANLSPTLPLFNVPFLSIRPIMDRPWLINTGTAIIIEREAKKGNG